VFAIHVRAPVMKMRSLPASFDEDVPSEDASVGTNGR
jgi:hypothetical protein